MCPMTVQGWTDAQKEFEGVAETVAVITIESVRSIIDGELRAETDVDAVAMRQVTDITEGVCAHGKDACVSRFI